MNNQMPLGFSLFNQVCAILQTKSPLFQHLPWNSTTSACLLFLIYLNLNWHYSWPYDRLIGHWKTKDKNPKKTTRLPCSKWKFGSHFYLNPQYLINKLYRIVFYSGSAGLITMILNKSLAQGYFFFPPLELWTTGINFDNGGEATKLEVFSWHIFLENSTPWIATEHEDTACHRINCKTQTSKSLISSEEWRI